MQQDGQADGPCWSSLSYLLTPMQAGKQGGMMPVGWELRGELRRMLGPLQDGDFLLSACDPG